ncbi:FecR domain-containing protein [Hyphomicrobium sp. LHD-15]|uniref:FecR family protein n=1 Tax=Hyphomicrobium sp. LHD-15 TaxID=3072142 RepID=UPI00280E6104|nr:FecR domain-containing protein [Hyphomicrobium sp. LHD-15]MDQ8699755.1 FecR domain-containing protein [Hyphomicrobium sp. LHD-15]
MADAPDDNDAARREHVRIVEQAAAWFAKLNDGKPKRHHQAEFAAWLGADPRHLPAYEDIQRLWNSAGDLPELKQHEASITARKITRRQLGIGALALAGGVGALYATRRPHADYETSTAERRTITLPDGSVADLSAQTRITLDYEPAARRINLLEGEAFFTVAAAPGRPFVVEAGAARATALGTAFSVANNGSAVRLLVTEHTVSLSAGARTARIDAGNRVLYDGRSIGPVEPADSAADLAWRDGRLVFTHAPFSEVVATINRWRPGRIVVVGEELARRPVTVIAEIERVDEVVTQLDQILPVRLLSLTPWLTLALPA